MEDFTGANCFTTGDFKLTSGGGSHATYWEPHTQDFDEMVVVRSGTGHCLVGEHRFDVAAGDTVVVPSHYVHGFEDTEGLKLSQVLYDAKQLLAPRPETLRLPGYHVLFVLDPKDRRTDELGRRVQLTSSQLPKVLEVIDQLELEEGKRMPGYETVMRACFMRLVVYLSRHYSRQEQPAVGTATRLSGVVSYLEAHYNQQVSLDDLAEVAFMSKNNLLRVFKRTYKVSPIEYLIRLRMVRACEQMQDPAKSISEIAYEVGFSDSNYFSRRFREIYGTPPSVYRRSMFESVG